MCEASYGGPHLSNSKYQKKGGFHENINKGTESVYHCQL